MEVAIPGYKTDKIIGKGGMAVVYLAIQESFDRQAALKVMSPHLTGDPVFGERFLREAKIIASLNHRNIVPVYDVGQFENFHYLSMEYLPGGDLKSRLSSGIRPDEALAVIYETANALAYAHSKSYIHRDIKPENILFREDNTSVLTDFGIAKALDTHDANMTSTGMIVGSPHYMSPEQALAKKIDTRSDIYSLGVVFYEVLVGRPLYKADSSVAAAIKHISEPIPKLPDCYSFLQDILEKMVAKKPEDRYQTAGEITQALEPFLMVPASTWSSLHLRDGEYETEGGTKIFTPPSITASGRAPSSTFRPTPLPVNRNAQPQSNSSHTTAIEMISWQIKAKESIRQLPATIKSSPKKVAAAAAIVLVPAIAVLSFDTTPPAPIEEKLGNIIEKPAPQISNTQKLEALGKKALRAERDGNLQSAHAYYADMQALESNNIDALAGIDRIAAWHLEKAFSAIEEKRDPEAALSALQLAKNIAPKHSNIKQVEDQLQKLVASIELEKQQVKQLDTEIKSLLSQAKTAFDQGRLIKPEGKSANDLYSRVLILDGKNKQAKDGLNLISEHYRLAIEDALSEQDIIGAKKNMEHLAKVDPQNSKLSNYTIQVNELTAELKQQQENKSAMMLASIGPTPIISDHTIPNTTATPNDLSAKEPSAVSSEANTRNIDQLLGQAKDALHRERLMFPRSKSAYHFYSQVLTIDPTQPDALSGLTKITQKYLTLSSRALNKGDLASAEKYVARGNQIVSSHRLGNDIVSEVDKMRTTIARVTYLEVMGEIEMWNDLLKNSDSVTVDNLNKAYGAYMAVLEEELKNAKVDNANSIYADAFFQLGKEHFKRDDMETSKSLIVKGLKISPNHKSLKDLQARWMRRNDGNERFLDRFY